MKEQPRVPPAAPIQTHGSTQYSIAMGNMGQVRAYRAFFSLSYLHKFTNLHLNLHMSIAGNVFFASQPVLAHPFVQPPISVHSTHSPVSAYPMTDYSSLLANAYQAFPSSVPNMFPAPVDMSRGNPLSAFAPVQMIPQPHIPATMALGHGPPPVSIKDFNFCTV
jgi:hypothetical protein